MKYFNTAGPVNQPDHYKIDPLKRWDLDEILHLIQQRKYFILHAPRQTGKTSALLALQKYLNDEGKYLALYANFEVGQASRNDIKSSMKAMVVEMANRISFLTNNKITLDEILEVFNKTDAENGLNSVLTYISEIFEKPVVLFIDEIDSLVGDTLISVLRQLRAGYDKRPQSFPSTVMLCGVRDIKDYRIQTSGKDIITGGSAFNIKAKSLYLGNFSKEDVINLYSQHTQETGQKFEEECFDLVMDYTNGQPWLVNALAYEVTYEMRENRDRSVVITTKKLEEAKERLILSNEIHLDQIVNKLERDWMRRILLPMILGDFAVQQESDIRNCEELNLLHYINGYYEVSNPIYKEIIVQKLIDMNQQNFLAMFRPDWVDFDGKINVTTLLTLFKDFWADNAGIWASNIAGYQEAAPQLVTQAFLQRVANGSGLINREYGIAKKRTDLMLKWKYEKGGQIQYQKIVMELKVIGKKQNYEKVKEEAITQTANYAQLCGSNEAHILIFDRDNKYNWLASEPNESADFNNIKMTIWKLGQVNDE